MTARDTAVIVKDALDSLGGGFMISPETRQAAKETGLRGWEMYFAGRAGVLGEVDGSVVAAALAFFPVEFTRARWDSARSKIRPPAAAERFAAACHQWGRARLSGFTGAERLADLMDTVAGSAGLVGLPLFAGWATVPRPDDPPARVARGAHLLREHRGGLHTVAVLATGLTPVEAIVAGPYGAENARFFQWAEPYPPLDDELRRRRVRAEDLTDDMVAPAYAVLSKAEAAELVDLLSEAQRVAFSSGS
jgi:Helix-turn-helix family